MRTNFDTYVVICNIPATPVYEVYILQLICYSRDCAQYSDFSGQFSAADTKATKILRSSSRTGWLLLNIHCSYGNGSFPFYVEFVYYRQDFTELDYMNI